VLKKASSADATSIIALFPWLAMPGKELSPLFSGPLWIALRLFPDGFAAIGKWFRRTAASPQAVLPLLCRWPGIARPRQPGIPPDSPAAFESCRGC
jgi:hypothetical protein